MLPQKAKASHRCKVSKIPAMEITGLSLCLGHHGPCGEDRFILNAPNAIAFSEFMRIRNMAGCRSESDGGWDQGYSGEIRR